MVTSPYSPLTSVSVRLPYDPPASDGTARYSPPLSTPDPGIARYCPSPRARDTGAYVLPAPPTAPYVRGSIALGSLRFRRAEPDRDPARPPTDPYVCSGDDNSVAIVALPYRRRADRRPTKKAHSTRMQTKTAATPPMMEPVERAPDEPAESPSLSSLSIAEEPDPMSPPAPGRGAGAGVTSPPPDSPSPDGEPASPSPPPSPSVPLSPSPVSPSTVGSGVGAGVGVKVGKVVGDWVGNGVVGCGVGFGVGNVTGGAVGIRVGLSVGVAVGWRVGSGVGSAVGCGVG
mmetsp:Transcript_10947/g.34767  ORF Transcript_10947/g.34767 Transcript_10947/m.34767 type:complete len:287 (+) Transcript_10947:338-1198(+)